MYRVFRTEWYEQKFTKLDKSEQSRVEKFEQALKQEPHAGKPLGYEWFREKKFDGKRLMFLIYEDCQVVFLITITDKKAQQATINFIKSNLNVYRELLSLLLKSRSL